MSEHAQDASRRIAYRKEKIVTFDRYRQQIDILNTILESGKEYTLQEVDARIRKFLKGQVK